jgi:hypothetical protein
VYYRQARHLRGEDVCLLAGARRAEEVNDAQVALPQLDAPVCGVDEVQSTAAAEADMIAVWSAPTRRARRR